MSKKNPLSVLPLPSMRVTSLETRIESIAPVIWSERKSKELDSIIFTGIALEYRALPLILQHGKRSPQQLFVGTLKGHAVHILSAVQLIHCAYRIDVTVRLRPLINIRRQLLRFSPQYPTSRLGLRIIPLPVAVFHKILHHLLYIIRAQLPPDVGILPQGAVMHSHRLDLLVRVVAQDQLPPQTHLLLPRGQHGLYCKEGRKAVEFRVLKCHLILLI
mmetsp:Transcript_22390/g.64269  ORF Transcript_22390/g.64269 Transcript_22390/m.64269 type:complete len:217 (-) Transcript_22390:123-773(-)